METRRWLVRASNSGVSAFVDPTGTIVDSLPFGAVGIIRRGITPAQSMTPYVRYGDWPVPMSILIVVWFWLGGPRKDASSRPGDAREI